MDVALVPLAAAAPAPPVAGTVGVGELMVDTVARRMWVGVAATVDPAQAVLVGDLVALQAEDADIRADFTTALADGLAGKANTAHTHTASQITDFTTAVQAVVGPSSGVPVGCILVWSGALSAVGVGVLAHYALCDGRNGTPNLVDKFVYGAGNLAVNTAGGSATVTGVTGFDGSHSHGGASGTTVLTVAQLPPHKHILNDPGHNHDMFTMATAGAGHSAVSGSSGGTLDSAFRMANAFTGITMNDVGSGDGHFHTIGADGFHQHTISISGGNLPPFLALAFIMRIT